MVDIEIGGLVQKKVVVTVLVAAAEVDDVVVVGIGNNAVELRIFLQFLIASSGIVHEP